MCRHVDQSNTWAQALGVSAGLRSKGYALMCVAYPRSDAVLELVEVSAFACLMLMWTLDSGCQTRACEFLSSRERRVCTGSSTM